VSSRAAEILMSGPSRKLALLLVPLLPLACREPAAPAAPIHPAFNFTNGPATAGTYVVRVADFDYLSLYIIPPDKTLDGDWWVVFVGLPNQPADWCTGLRDAVPTSVQLIEQEARTHALRQRDNEPLYVWHWLEFADVWDAGGGGVEGLCQALALPRVAAGIASERSTDNDLFGQTGQNAWGWMANGELTYQGRTYNMQIVLRALFLEQQGFRIVAEQYRFW
jgi:hypothetical protein